MSAKEKKLKSKSKGRAKLSPAEFRSTYARLENAPLEKFIAEFLVRNRIFIKDCKTLLEAKPADVDIRVYDVSAGGMLLAKYGVIALNWWEVVGETEHRLRVKLLPAVRGIRIVKSTRQADVKRLLGERGNAFAAEDFETVARYDIRGTDLSYLGPDETAMVNNKTSALDVLMGDEPAKDGKYLHDDVLLLGVDLNRPRHEILGEFKRYLDVHLLQNDARVRRQEWIRYLMVFDLVEFWDKTVEEAEHFLVDAFPEVKRRKKRAPTLPQARRRQHSESSDRQTDENFFEEPKNVKDCYDGAKRLIAGNYRKYITFSQTK